MPAIEGKPAQPVANQDDEIIFPPVTREHILHCSYDYWFPKYRTSCIRSEIIPLTPDFVSYIHEDGIVLADDPSSDPNQEKDEDDNWEPTNPSSDFPPPPRDPRDESGSEDDDDDEPTTARLPPNQRFPELHQKIESTIAQLGGSVAPKLNWSSPRDATWISRHPNTIKCTSANDIYILLKSSSFISHDLDHAFDDCAPTTTSQSSPPFQPVLVLRSYFNILPSLEFRCFVKDRNLVAITQRDPNYYPFLRSLRPHIVSRIRELFTKRLKFTFPEADFSFDVYIPEASYDDEVNRLGRARLIDINPWAPRTDTILFGWDELLGINVKRPVIGGPMSTQDQDESEVESESDDDEEGEEEDRPELRLVEKDDPAAYNFSSPAFSAHKLPKDVVDASQAGEGGGMRELAETLREFERGRREGVQQGGQGRVEEVMEEPQEQAGGSV
ncbi:Putative cell division cycle protein 123 CD123 [Podospora comata]|uniref:Cell division cycle protein 123 CD123 n=1 Tax=Podospora comata TaxID=48703 RepID=A0ABY6SKF8_PODCO|nr:Putative cell division cycle protein 123 CD123 [Podospora comata]